MNHYFTTLRSLWKNKSYNLLNIGGLAIGITCAILILLWVEDEITFDQSFKNLENVYRVNFNQVHNDIVSTSTVTPGPMAEVLRTEVPGIIHATRMASGVKASFNYGDKSFYEEGSYVDSGFLSMFSLDFAEGSLAHAFDQLHAVVITKSMEKKLFEGDALGKSIMMNAELFQVTGVIEDLPDNVSLKFKWLASIELITPKFEWLNRWDANSVKTLVQLQPNSNVKDVEARVKAFKEKAGQSQADFFLFPLRDWHLNDSFKDGKQNDQGKIRYVRIFSFIALLIVLIASINFMNLATARAQLRAKEVGVRKTLGAGRYSLIRQFMTEALSMSFLAVSIAIGIAYLALPSFNTLIERNLLLNILNPLHLTCLVLIGTVCGLASGIYPSFYLSSFNPVKVFKGMRTASSGRGGFIRQGLVVLQFGASIMLIICTVIIFQQVQYTKDRDLGFRKEQLIHVNAAGKIQEHFNAIKSELIQSGMIENASLSVNPITQFGWYSSDNYKWQGKDQSKNILVITEAVTPEYISTAGITLKEGKDFYTNPEENKSVVIINQSMATLIGEGGHIGNTLIRGDQPLQIIGVMNDFVIGDIYSKNIAPAVLICSDPIFNSLTVRIAENANTPAAISKVGEVLRKYNPDYPFDFQFIDDEFNSKFKTEAFIKNLIGIFAILTIFISCLGLFGLAAFSAGRRTKEIGVRKVMGASLTGLTTLLLKDFMILVLLSCLLAFPLAAWAMTNWLQHYEYQTPIYWWVFAGAGLMAFIISLLTVSIHTLKVARLNPVESLRME